MPKHAGGRPPKYTDKYKQDLLQKFDKYINDNIIPIITEFSYMNNIPSQQMYDFPEFSSLLTKCIEKKITNLEKGALTNKINVSMAIFSLKQCGKKYGWTERQDITTNDKSINIVISADDKTVI